MFDKFGQPYGYGQIAPGRDQPAQPGNAPPPPAPTSVQGSGASQYPQDPSMASWRRRNGAAQPIGPSPDTLPPPQAMSALHTAVMTPRAPLTPASGATAPPSQGGLGAPSGGSFRDPAYAAAFIQHYASQPGANPSLTRDPGYWQGKITSGELGDDPNYIISKFMKPEGAPAGQHLAQGPGSMSALLAAISGQQQQQQQATASQVQQLGQRYQGY